jgi:hypothetical protein
MWRTFCNASYRPARPVQQPRVPIWVVGAWPRPKSMRRVLRCDGLLPLCFGEDGLRDTLLAS